MSVTINGTNGITFNDASTQTTAATGFGFKNRIINGAMIIDQRNAGASVTPAAGAYLTDRFQYDGSQASKFTAQQNAGSVTPPAGFRNYLGFTVASAVSITSSDYFQFVQKVEGFNMADLAWGTASAAPVTLSFWIRSSLTGTFGGSLRNGNADRSYPYTYTISAANTWEQKTITIAGDTTGTWATTNGVGIIVAWGLGNGSNFTGTAGAWAATNYQNATGATSVVGTNGATFYITGVQLEKGSTATSFDYRPYGTELALCQRYYQVLANGSNLSIGLGGAYTATSVYMSVPLKVSMRSAPTLSATSGTNYYIFYRNGANDQFNSLALEAASTEAVELNNTADISGTVGWAGMVRTNNASAVVAFSSEL